MMKGIGDAMKILNGDVPIPFKVKGGQICQQDEYKYSVGDEPQADELGLAQPSCDDYSPEELLLHEDCLLESEPSTRPSEPSTRPCVINGQLTKCPWRS